MTALRRHLLEHVPVPNVSDEVRVRSVGIGPTALYRWQDESTRLASSLRGRDCTSGAALFEPRPRNEETPSARQVAALEEKLTRRNEVVSELLEELVRLKETNGGL
jgi:transposase